MEIGADRSVYTGRRRDSRLRLRRGVPATLMTLDGKVSANLLDLSFSGAHVRADFVFHTGQQMMLWWLEYETFGTVVWARDNEAGLEFDEPLPTATILRTREKVDLGHVKSPEELAREQARDWFLSHR